MAWSRLIAPIGQVVGRLNEIRSVRDVMMSLALELEDTLARLASSISG